jgi:hypothetical protein
MKTTKLEKTGACREAILYVKEQENYVKAWQNCPRGDWMLWIAAKLKVDKRLLTLAKGKCAETVLHLMRDQRSKDAVRAAIDYGHGIISDEQLRITAAAACAVYDAAAYAAAAAAAYAAAYAAAAAYYAAAAAYAAYAAYYAAYAAAAAYATYDAACAARKQNQLQTANICREILTEVVLSAWKKQR